MARISIEIARGDLNPRFFNYPTLFMYAAGTAYRGYCEAASVAGRADSAKACLDAWPVHWEPFVIIARVISAIAGVLTISLVYRLARRFDDEIAATVAATFLAGAFLHVRDSHFGVTDVTMTLLVVGAVLLLVRAHDDPSVPAFAWAGLVAGLATATKYNGLLLVCVVGVSQWLAFRDGRRLDWRIPAFVVAMACGFVLGTPYALVDRARFWADASGEALHLATGHGTSLRIGWVHHLVTSLRFGLTLPLLIAALVGAGWMAARLGRRALLLLAFPVVYYVVAGRGYTVFARYMVPVIPFLCVAAGSLVASLAAAADRGPVSGHRPAIAALLALALVLPSAVQIARFDRLLSRTDSRVLASEWIAGEVPDGATVYLAGGMYGAPDLARRGAPPPYRIWEFDERRGTFDTPTGLTAEWPEWIVIQESPLTDYSRIPEAVREGLRGYGLRRTFRAVNLLAPHVYDQQDAFFLPLSGFSGIGRPGPNISIYRRH